MRLSFVCTVVAALAASVDAYKASVKRKHILPAPTHPLARRSPQSSSGQVNVNGDDGDNKFDIQSVHDMIYLADMTVGGVEYSVQLDTGSSDLFIKGQSYPIPGTEETDIFHNLTYAVGWAAGNIAYAPVNFIGIPVESQAFVDSTSANNPALGLGANGVVGLGFNRLSSIDHKLNGTQSSRGRSLLYNLFAANPDEPNFIAFVLHRAVNSTDEEEGSFAIGEFEPEYVSITANPSIPTWPPRNPYRWNVLLDATIIIPPNSTESRIVPGKTNVPNAPSNKAVVLLDSGASYTYAPPDVVEAMYGDIPGAHLNTTAGAWIIPCDAEVNVALQIGGQVFPVHPLDAVMQRNPLTPSVCIGTFIPQAFDASWDFDWLIGDNFLRSVYAVYDFGDFDSQGKMGDPYVKLLTLVIPDDASGEFHESRGGEPKKNLKFIGLDGVEIAPSFSISTDISESLDMIGRYMPAMLAVVGFNALVLVVGTIVWLVMFIRRRRRRATARHPRARTGATSRADTTRPNSAINSYIAGLDSPSRPVPHTYEPVSMALTEDTFVPPSPAFLSSGYGKLQPGERPKSVA